LKLSGTASSKRQNESGFTLIEAVVAIALLAVMLAAIGSVVAASRKATLKIEEHVALLETARMVATVATERAAVEARDLGGEASGHSWRARITPLTVAVAPVEGSPWIPRTVMVEVQSPSGAVFSLETIRLQKMPPRPVQ
jgi:general secretion pathway protein I